MVVRNMVARWPGEVLLGRRNERDALDRLLAAALGGQSGVLVLVGEPGIGKTALLNYAIQSASAFQVARAGGVEWEMELPFAAAQQLCAPILDRVERLPDRQRDALSVAFGVCPGEAPDRFLVGLAVLSLFSEVAREKPVLCVVDDAQWLDRASAQTLAFVARRLLADRVALLFAAREAVGELRGLPQLRVNGLGDGDARSLLVSALGVSLDQRVRERIIAETRGNPLALLELPRELRAAEVTAGYAYSVPPALPRRIEQSFQRRLGELPRDTRRLLLVAAAEPVGDPAVMWRAAEQLGIGIESADADDLEGWMDVGARVTFRHPLVRSAVYRAAAPRDRKAVHSALAEATDPAVDPDHRAWHRAQATAGPDEEVACELDRSASRALACGGWAAAAAFLEKAVALTPDSGRRAERALAAAQARFQAGAFDASIRVLATAEAGPLAELDRAQVDRLRAEIAFAVQRRREAPKLLLSAARRLAPLDVGLARETYLEALLAAIFVGRLGGPGELLEIAQAARAAPASPSPARAVDLLLDGYVLLVTEGYPAAAATLKQALAAFRAAPVTREQVRWLWIVLTVATALWDEDSYQALGSVHLDLVRETGALAELPIAINSAAGVHIRRGELDVAASLIGEAETAIEATGNRIVPYAAISIAILRGQEDAARDLIKATTKELAHAGDGAGVTLVHSATAELYNGLGRYDEALAAAQQAADDPTDLFFATWGLVELIEAAARAGEDELASDPLRRLSAAARASGTDLALGFEARSRALLSEGDLADSLYREAIERLERTAVRVELSRAHLVYGEWLRRERRRLDAREQLRRAHAMFTDFGMEAFAERARVELEATGERARVRTEQTRDDLTPQEAQISRLAADGATNQEIAARLFISPSTVDYHLRKAFRKLGVRSRTQLARQVLDAGSPSAQTRDR
jgi:DNA-binding CsgD family transcriptional regulator/tetratricopeptide (TPR) repeat protein